MKVEFEPKDYIAVGSACVALFVFLMNLRERHNSLRVALFNRQADAYLAITKKAVELNREVDALIDEIRVLHTFGVEEIGERLHGKFTDLIDAGSTYAHLHLKASITSLGIVSMRFSVLETCVLRWAMFPYDEQLFAMVEEAQAAFRSSLSDYANTVRDYLAVERISKSFRSLNKQTLLNWLTFRKMNKLRPELEAIPLEIVHEPSDARHRELFENMNALFAQDATGTMPIHPEVRAKMEIVRKIRDRTAAWQRRRKEEHERLSSSADDGNP